MNYLFTLLLTPVAYVIGLATANKWLPIVLPTLVGFAGFLFEMRNSAGRGLGILVLWAVVQSITVLLAALWRGAAHLATLTWRAAEYKASMFGWIQSGALPEGNALSVTILHLKQALFYCVLALASANFLSLLLGCALLNYMNVYVAEFASRTSSKVQATLMAWNPWSVIRVAAFLCLGTALSVPLLSRFGITTGPAPQKMLWAGVAGVMLDIVLKIVMSPYWSRRLKAFLPASVF
ncbi:MAG TPA: hypothetical protein VI958_07405 [Acidobacteriota bacterium]